MEYLVGPNNRSNNFEPLRDICVKICNEDNCTKCDKCTKCDRCTQNCLTDCGNNCGVNGCYCLVGNGRNEINSTGSFI